MVATFFSTNGLIATIVLENQRIAMEKWCTEICLPKVFSSIQDRPEEGFLLHQDNASAYMENATITFLEGTPVKLMIHPHIVPTWDP